MFQASLQRTAFMLAAPLRQVATMSAALRDQRKEAGTAGQNEVPAGESSAGQDAPATEPVEATAE
jgi:hypothetical protein